MKFNNASKQFEENLKMFGDAHTNPEKYNLYAGLMNLADGLSQMEARLDSIERTLRLKR